MSGFQYYGHRVADSKPVIREGGKDADELQNAWDGMAKAKSALRRAEYRVSDVDKPKGSYLSANQLEDYVSHDLAVPIDKVPSYKIMEKQGSDTDSVKVDKFGKTTYMKSKQDRKVVRIEDRYQEKGGRQRSPLREPNTHPSQPPGVRENGPPRSSYLTTTTNSSDLPGHANYSRHHGSYDVDSYLRGDKYSSASERDITGSTAVRETELNFPNDFSVRPHTTNSQPSRLHHVDVKVPSDQPKSSLLAAKNVPVRHVTSLNGERWREGSKPDRMYQGILNGLEKPSNSASSNGVSEGTNTTYTIGDLDAVRKMQKTLKDISTKTDGLDRVRELIRQQRMNIAQKDSDSARSSQEQANTKRHHHDDEPVAPKKYAIYEADKPASSTRKVAAGPPAPTYKGFNTTETKYQLPDGKVVKLSELKQKKKAKRERIISKAHEEKRSQAEVTENTGSVPGFPEKHRKVAKKPSKYQANQDIITTTSWRAGQKLVRKELGPSKVPKAPPSPPTKDQPDGQESDSMEVAVDSGAAARRDPAAAKKEAPVEVPREQPLSRSAKDVLNDLQLDKSDSEGEDGLEGGGEGMADKHKSPPKRARPKSPDGSKEQKARRVRHYDSNEVRRYILRQKADRRRQESAEREARQRAEDERQRQLKELYSKQHEAARSKARQKQEALHGEIREKKYQGESDKENRSRSDGSSDSGTLTENSSRGDRASEIKEDAHRGLPPPESKPRPTDKPHLSADKPHPSADKPHPSLEDHMETANELIAKYVADQAGKTNDPVPVTGGALSVADVMRKFTNETGMTTEDIVSKYAGRAQAIGGPIGGPTAVPSYHGEDHVDSARSLPPRHLELTAGRPLSASTGTSYRTRAERIASLCNTASSLSTRVQLESQRLAKEIGPDKWAYPRLDEVEEDYIGRYQRIGGSKRDQPVFSTDLPGMKSLSAVDSDRRKKVAATKIQAAYRGHHSRRSIDGQGPDYRPAPNTTHRGTTHRGTTHLHMSDRGTTHLHMSEDDLSDLGDSTITDDSLVEGSDYKKMKGSLRPSKPVPRWTTPEVDPYSIINIYSRRQAESAAMAGAGGDPASEIISHHSRSQRTRSPQPLSARSDDYRSDFETGKSLSYRSERSAQSASYKDEFSEPTRSRTMTSERTRTEKTTSDRMSSHKSMEQRRIVPGAEANESEKEDHSLEYEDTLDGTLTHSLDSDEDREKSVVPTSRSLQRSAHVEMASDLSGSGLSDPEDEAPPMAKDPLLHNMPPTHATRTGFGGVTRMSPAALQSRMALELNLLESMEESVRQLTDVERSRAVSLAQQETVSLAQILKARQQDHSRGMAELQLKAQQESLAASRQLEEARHRASDATQTAAQTLSKVREDTSTSLQEASRQLIETQLQATHATAEAAKTLAQAKVTLRSQRSEVMSEEAVTKATTAAATAAVEAVLQNYRHIPGKAVVREARGTQYSERSVGGTSRGTELSHTTDVSRSETSNGSYMADSFDESYTRSDPSDPSTKYLALAAKKQAEVKRPAGSESEASEIHTTSDLSPRGRDKDSVRTASVATASDLSPKALSSGELSSVATESAARPPSPGSKSESIAEEIHSDLDRSERDYSLDFDTSVTEEDMEKSMREMIPAESLRKRFKTKSGGSTRDVSTDEPTTVLPHIPGPSDARRLSFEEDSFTKFTVEMVKQYMREEETRAQHQNTLLKLREQALKEKIKAELAWIKQQQQRTRKKGEDDVYPMLKKKERGLIRRLQQEQAEIKRLQEANRAASKERKMLLLQSQEIAKLHQSTKQIKQKLREYKRGERSASSESLSMRLSLSDQSLSGSESTSCLDELDDGETSQPSSPRKDETDQGRPPSPSDSQVMQKLKKMKLEGKYLTVREQRLQQRRKKAEELIAWNHRLDEEEAEIERIEKQAKAKKAGQKKDKGVRPLEQAVGKDTLQLTPRTPRTHDRDISKATTIDESIASESHLVTDRPAESARSRTQKSITEEISTALSGASRTETRPRTGSEGSIQEDISETRDYSEIHTETRTRKTHDESPDETGVNTSANESYSNETFDSATETQAPTTAAKSVATASATSPRAQSGLPEVTKEGGLGLKSPKSPTKAPFSPTANARKGSESESDDSMTMGYSETASDQSDVENRIRTLKDELKRSKMEAEKLKKEKKKRMKDKLHEQEKSLKKQIEAYDVYISQVKTEITGDSHVEPPKSPVKPQIKQPSESKQRRKPAEEVRGHSEEVRGRSEEVRGRSEEVRGRSESESSKSSLEDTAVSAVTSPIAAGPDDTLRQQESPSPLRMSKAATETVSEQSKKTSTPVKSSVSGEEQEVSEDIAEELPSVVYSETFTSDRMELRLNLDQVKEEGSRGEVTPRDNSQVTPRDNSQVTPRDNSQVTPRDNSQVTPRDNSQGLDSRLPDTARSLSEIAEEYSIPTGHSESEAGQLDNQGGVHLHLDLKERDEKVPLSARSDSERALSARSESEKAPLSARSESARSDYSYEDDESEISSRTDTRSSETKTYSRDSESRSQSSSSSLVDSQKRDQSEASEGTPRKPSAKSDPKQKAVEREESIAESLSTEGDISEDLGEESEEDEPLFDLNKVAQPPPEAPSDLQAVPQDIDPLRNFSVGDRVLIGGVQPGTLRYKGYTKFSSGVWGGVELDGAEGSNNGTKDGVSYFMCKHNFGLFAPPDKISLAPPPGSVPEVGEESDATVTETEDKPPLKSLGEEIADVIQPTVQTGEDEEHSVAESAATVDSEMENLIRSTSQAVEEFAGVERAVSPSDTILSEGATPRDVTPRDVTPREVDKKEETVKELAPDTLVSEAPSERSSRAPREESVNSTAELTINNLLNEAISQMISIHQQRQVVQPLDTPEDTASTKTVLADDGENEEVKIEKDRTENETKKSLLNLDDAALALLRPKSPEPTIIKQNDLDSIYKELESIGGDDEWFDDEFGVGLSSSKPPPPYPDKPERPGKVDFPELRLDLQKLTEELYFAVPHKPEEVTPVVDEVIDVFWEMRRYGESWDEVSVPESFYKADDKGADMEGRSKHAHKRLVFDLTAEILRDMYQEEEEVEVESRVWEKPSQTSKRRYNKNKTPPTTSAQLKPIVQDMVLEVLQLKGKGDSGKSAKKWGGRKKKDRVDQILVAELREEEPDWVNYDADELSVKLQLADTLFESLLSETTKVMSDITQRRATTQRTEEK